MQKGSLNKVQLIGRLGADPDSKVTDGGVAVCNFSVATNEYYQDKDHVEWTRCVMFGKAAEIGNEYLTKGQLVYVEGRLQTRKWEDPEGDKHYMTEVVVNIFTMLSGGSKSKEEDEIVPGPPDEPEDDLPF